jgi:hypothetical protein
MLGLLVVALLCTATVLLAQDEDIVDLVNQYPAGYQLMPQLIETIMWSAAYLLIYAAALVAPLMLWQRFTGFDSTMLAWIAVLWLGGQGINALVYRLTPHGWLAALIALPLLFGWTLFLATRSWADVLWRDALRLSLIVALCCAPYFGPTWRIKPPPPPATSRQLTPSATTATQLCATSAHAILRPWTPPASS